MQLKAAQLVNIIIQLCLMAGSAFVGYYIGKDETFIFVVVIIYLLEAIVMRVILQLYFKAREELDQERKELSQELFSLKAAGQNNINITIFPEEEAVFSSAAYSNLIVTVNTPNEVDEDFDFQVKSDHELDLLPPGGASANSQYHAGRYTFFIGNNVAEKRYGRYYKLILGVKPKEANQHYLLEVTAHNVEVKGAKTFSFHSKNN